MKIKCFMLVCLISAFWLRRTEFRCFLKMLSLKFRILFLVQKFRGLIFSSNIWGIWWNVLKRIFSSWEQNSGWQNAHILYKFWVDTAAVFLKRTHYVCAIKHDICPKVDVLLPKCLLPLASIQTFKHLLKFFRLFHTYTSCGTQEWLTTKKL